ncbi:ATP-binding cassette domain-containing protein [Vibrio mediterranei]|uniref:ABC-F family ATP-binding cassette domain-containing protein n=1 Tax=Vibrio mediterranei TaxID=689 RepID=UPI001EFCED14|nr:ABC-F family ATP-binding cassette domain-containing protein [Vibrio mediterranei]MCG9626921.1 ATP-binding cassette domain-containing protein [Vibrio mediterranei]
MSTLLSVQSLSYDLPSCSLLDRVSFTINKGDRIGLIGHNGCGKSTLIRLMFGEISPKSGTISRSNQCLISRIEQYLPTHLLRQTLLASVLDVLPREMHLSESWRAEALLSEMGFSETDRGLVAGSLSGGQHTRLLMARALITEPDLLLLDEPSNHLDLPTLLWLENFLSQWRGTFVLVSHDKRLLDSVTNSTIILRDRSLSFFALPCSEAREALSQQDEADFHRNQHQQKEIDRIEHSAKRLSIWGHVYNNASFSRKAQSMEKRVAKLKDSQTELTDGSPWTLQLHGLAMRANRLLELSDVTVKASESSPSLFQVMSKQIKSGDRIALIGRNGCGKSSMMRHLWQAWLADTQTDSLAIHPQCRIGYYDQNQEQLDANKSLIDALQDFSPLPEEQKKMALISAGFAYHRHSQLVSSLSGGEKARLLFIALSLAKFHLLFLDEPTNHLDLEGKEELIDSLTQFVGAFILVTHDRELMEKSCNRFWLIHNGELKEYYHSEQLYTVFDTEIPAKKEPATPTAMQRLDTSDTPVLSDEEKLLERLLELETKLEADLKRKKKYQKPKLQQAWQQEIDALNQQLKIN